MPSWTPQEHLRRLSIYQDFVTIRKQTKLYTSSNLHHVSMTIQISPASSQDAGDLSRLIVLGNANDAMFTLIVSRERNATPAQKAEHLRWRTERTQFNMQRAGTHWFKAVDTATGEAVGFAGVVAPENEASAWDGTMSETIDEKWFAIYSQATTEKKEALLEGREDVWCEFCNSLKNPAYLVTDSM